MGTSLGDALAKKGLVDQKQADEAAERLRAAREEKDRRLAEAEKAEQQTRADRQNAEQMPPPAEWLDNEGKRDR